MAIPLLIDTDIGDDVDDALALALALRSPEVELVGVTTVYQCAPLRARLAGRLLAAFGRADVPVLAGTDRPLLGAVRPDWVPNQALVLQGGPQPAVTPGRAVEFIIREGLRRDDLVLLPIGAMTNVALAFALEPRLLGRVRVVAMAGAWDREGGEYNVQCDPEAVAAVLACGAGVDFVGLDVTMQVALRAPDLARLAAAPAASPEAAVLAFVRACQRAWRKDDSFCPTLHDPLAVAAVFRPDLLGWEEGVVRVELGQGPARGATGLLPPAAGPAARTRVARTVEVEAFLELFGNRVCGGGG